MVYLTRFLASLLEVPIKVKRHRGFLDQMRVHVRAGTGGMGNPKYGGVGGKGGDIYVAAKKGIDLSAVLKDFPDKRIKAGHGGNSVAKQLLGSRGYDVVVHVPCGVQVISEYKTLIGEVNADGEKLLIAKGGLGGCSTNNFSGMKGQAYSVNLELRLIADVGLLGFPNAGKSTLLKACSNANPKIANYPFTTIKPNIGVVEYPDYRKVTMADLPGIIEGAHANHGLGHKFLRHVERTKLMLMVVDIGGFRLNLNHKHYTALETILILNKELELYNQDLLDKPISLIVNKMDLPNAEETYQTLMDKLKNIKAIIEEIPEEVRPERLIQFEDILAISAKNGNEEVANVKDHVRLILDKLREENLEPETREEVQQKLLQLRRQQYESGPVLI